MSRLLPNWIQAYLAYTHSSESPEEYHLWTALSTISGALRRKCWFDMAYFLLYPNLYVVLVGPPGRCKKSTAMRIGRSMLGKVPGMNFTTDSVTRERLIQDLSQSFKDGHASMTAYSSEFASLLTSSGMDMVVFLTDIFDSPAEWSHKTKLGGTNSIQAPYLNLFAATTPDWIAKAMPLDTVGIGLTSRIIFVYQDTPRRRPSRPQLTQEQRRLEQLLISDLQQIATISGEFRFSPEADEAYERWYDARFDDPNPSGDPRLSGFYERKPMHLIKVAIIVASAKRQGNIIELEDLEDAIRIFELTEEKMPKVFSAVGTSPIAFTMEKVLDVIEESPGPIKFSTLLGMFRRDARKDDMEEILATLCLTGAVQKVFDADNPADPKYAFKGYSHLVGGNNGKVSEKDSRSQRIPLQSPRGSPSGSGHNQD